MKRKALILCLGIIMIFTAMVALTVNALATIYTGACGVDGSNLTYKLDTETKFLEIMGNGEMRDYESHYNGDYYSTAPWSGYKLKGVKISPGVTKIGKDAFFSCEIENLYITSLEKWLNMEFYCRSESSGGFIGWRSNHPFFEVGGNFYVNGELTTDITIPNSVTSIGSCAFYNCDSIKSVKIPDSVTSIGNYAFYDCSSLESIEIPDSVTSIGSYAFSGCSNLTSVVIPDSVTSIGSHAFSGCSNLTSVVIPDSVTSIGAWAFGDCSSLTSVEIGDRVTSIGSYAFYGTALYNDSSNLVDGVLYIGNHCIKAKTDISGSYAIKAGTLTIANDAFHYCRSLTSVVIPDSVTSIGDSAFEYCSSLTSVEIPDSVTSIGSSAFYNCSSLKDLYISDLESWLNVSLSGSSSHPLYSAGGNLYIDGVLATDIEIPDTVTSIGSYAFRGCSSLTSVTIPDSVTSIGDYAFSDCSSLTSVVIPGSVTSIGYNAFSGCKIKHIVLYRDSCADGYFSNSNKVYIVDSDEDFLFTSQNDENLLIAKYIGDSEAVSIPDSYNGKKISGIAKYAFYNCDRLKSVHIPESVTSFGENIFSLCDNIEEITVSYVGYQYQDGYYSSYYSFDFLFGGIVPEKLKKVTVLSGAITSNTFAGCSNIESVIIGENVAEIEKLAFSSCSNLGEISLPDTNVVKVYFNSFDGTLYYNNPDNWENGSVLYVGKYLITAKNDVSPQYTVRDGTKALAIMAFADCSALTDITIPDSVKNIGDQSFFGCPSLLRVMLGNGIERIGVEAFADCSALEAVYISDIESWCKINFADPLANPLNIAEKFYINNALTANITVPEGIAEIKPYAFYNFEGLVNINLPAGVTKIGDQAFYGCERLMNITVPDDVAYIGYQAFRDCSRLLSIKIPAGIETIFYETFYNCSSLQSIDLPSSVICVEDNAFYNCRSMISANLGGVESVGSYAFQNCAKLESVIVPASLEWVGFRAFQYCYDLESVYITDLAAWCNLEFVYSMQYYSDDYTSNPFYYARNLYIDETLAEEITIPEEITTLDNYDFINCASVKILNLHSKIQKIEPFSIIGCSSIQAINVADYNSYFSSQDGVLFDKMLTNLIKYPEGKSDVSYEIPESVVSVEEYAFNGANLLTSIMIRKSLVYIGDYAFQNMKKLSIVRFEGTEEDWSYISIGSYNPSLENATKYFNVKSIPGDPSGDGEINAVDAVLLAQKIAGWDVELDISAADCNGDGEVNAIDAVLLAQFIAGWDVTLG